MIFPSKQSDRPFVLLTGATGLVGGHLLARLLSSGVDVAVLIRGQRRSSAQQRLDALMSDLERRFGRLFERPVLLDGELCKPGLGLTSDEHRWLSQHCGSVIHCAASISFRPTASHPQREPFRTNVEGTSALLALTTKLGIREWHYVSTAYVAGTRQGFVAEEESLDGREFGNDYENSKAQAERMLRQSDGVDSLTVYRPSIVLEFDSNATPGADQTISQTFSVFRMLASQAGLPERGVLFKSLGLQGTEGKNLVAASWVGRLIAEIWRHPKLHGRTYHLTNQNTVSVEQLEASFHVAVEAIENSNRTGSLAQAINPSALNWAEIQTSAAPFVAAFQPYFRDDPQFGRASTEAALRRLGIDDQPVPNVEQLSRFCIASTRSSNSAGSTAERSIRPVALPEYSSVSAWVHQETGGADSEITRFVVQIVGEGGGRWLVTGSDVLPCSAAEAQNSAACVTTAQVWNSLCKQPEQCEKSLRNGSLLIEYPARNVLVSEGARDIVIRSLEQFLRRSSQRLKDASLPEEVGHVR